MLSHSQQLDEVRNLASASHLLNSASPNRAQQEQELKFKLQQMQNQIQQQRQLEMLSKMMNIGNVHRQQPIPRNSPLPEMGVMQARELLNRPEAQAILQGEFWIGVPSLQVLSSCGVADWGFGVPQGSYLGLLLFLVQGKLNLLLKFLFIFFSKLTNEGSAVC